MGLRNYVNKFLLLSWLVHRTQWNRPLELAWIIFAPLLMCCIAVGMRMTIDVAERFNTYYGPIDLDQSWTEMIETLQMREKQREKLNRSNSVLIPQLVLAWAPSDYNLFEKIMELAMDDLKSMGKRNFSDCPEMEEAIKNEYLFAGICFDGCQFEKKYNFVNNHLNDDEMIMPHFNYTILFPSELRMFNSTYIGNSWKTIYQDDPTMSVVHRINDKSSDAHLAYVREGFIKIQKAISEAFLKVVSKTQKELPTILLRRFPVDGRIQDPEMSYINRGLPLLIIMGFMFPAQILIWQIVQEKEHQLRLFLINMNIGNIVHFLAWFFRGLTYMLISSILITAIVKVPWKSGRTLLTQTPWYVILLVLSAYNMAVTSFVLMIASFYKKSVPAVRVMTLIWLLSYMPFFVLYNNREKCLTITRYISYTLPNTVLALVCEGIMEREVFFDRKWVDQGYSMSYVANRINIYQGTCILLIATCVYAAIAVYMDVWNSGETGGRRRKRLAAPAHSGDFTIQDRDDSFMPQGSQQVGFKATKIYEVEPSHRRFKIKIKKLSKRYAPNNRGALKSLTWNVYENEVTVLMGHNGCGKTTLLKILAGLVEPTRGVVVISDYNIQTERHDASMQLGLALGEDMLLPDLTVADQIRFTCMVKGVSWKDCKDEIETYTQLLHLSHVKMLRVRSLTYRDRKLLSICCAFAGGSPIILIDDIHCDLDLVTEALICRLINEEKSRRTIIVVSNSTLLATNLADRLAIMSNGELKCTGSKPFLRNMYGHGFRLTFIKGKSFDLSKLTNLLAKYLPNLTIESEIGYKLTFILENKFEDKFPSLFDDLEDEMENLNIMSFRLRDTSLDEIFLRFGSEEGEVSGEPTMLVNNLKLVHDDYQNTRVKGFRLIAMNFCALIYMRWILNKHHWSLKIINAIALLIAVVCSFSAMLLYGKHYQLIPLSFNLTQLHCIDAFVEVMSSSFDAHEMQEFYAELLFWYDGHIELLETPDPSDFYLLQQNEFNKIVNFRYLFGASIDSDLITVWFNNIPLHAAPYGLNLVHNVVARRFFNEEASIDVSLQPLPFQININYLPQTQFTLGAILAINFSFVFSHMWQGIALASVFEASFKRQQFLTGLRPSVYGFTLILYDVICVTIVSIFIALIICLFLIPRSDLNLYLWVFSAFFLTGNSVIALSYLIYDHFKEPNNAFIVISLVNVLGMIFFTTIVGDELVDMMNIFQPLIEYNFGEVMFKLFFLFEYQYLCADQNVWFISNVVEKCDAIPNCCISYNYWNTEFGVIFDLFIFIGGIAIPFFLFFIFQQYAVMACSCLRRAMPKKCTRRGKPAQNTRNEVDETVIAERRRVAKLTKQEHSEFAVVCQGIGKRYGKKAIISRIDLCISNAECIGILGYNNCGKTTFVKMLVGETQPSHGRIWICGYSLEQERDKCYPLIGYCPQAPKLLKEATPRDLLFIQAMLHGLPKKRALLLCEELSHVLGFHSCYRHKISLCTTGQIRRIAFANAMLGDPMLICVDGPPGGLDPNGTRILFSLTAYMQNRGCSFLYTNLSSLECERMCQRIPILYDGKLWTLGGQDENYVSGYNLDVHFKRKANADISTARGTWDRINQFPVSPHNKLILFVQIKFPEATLQHQQESSMTFFMPHHSTTFSEIFVIIRKDAFELNIEDFVITRNFITGMHADLFDRAALKIVP